MAIDILMPALSPTMEKGNLAKWHVKVGDVVKSGDVLAEIETDKATMEVEAVDEGAIVEILVAEGTADVAVNAVIARIAGEGAAPAPKPVAAPVAAIAAPVVAAVAAPAAAIVTNGPRVFASPLARRIAKQKGLDLTAIAGTGPHGRIILRDVENAVPGAKPAVAPTAAPAPAASAPAPAKAAFTPPDESWLKLYDPSAYEIVPHDGMRKVIARRLQESKQFVPHFYLSADIELDALLKLRAELNASAPEKNGKPAYKLSVNDLVIKAMALALKAIPDANVSWTENGMVRHKFADVAVAVSIPGGLITPVVKKAETKSLSAISAEVKDLAARAKDRKLKPEEYQGGTTSVSNLGMFGVKQFAAIINPPHATILAVGAGEERVVVKNGAPAVATVMTCTLSTDHRAVDGALGAELMQAFKGFIEKPFSLLV